MGLRFDILDSGISGILERRKSKMRSGKKERWRNEKNATGMIIAKQKENAREKGRAGKKEGRAKKSSLIEFSITLSPLLHVPDVFRRGKIEYE